MIPEIKEYKQNGTLKQKVKERKSAAKQGIILNKTKNQQSDK
jgi:hypothetical protein